MANLSGLNTNFFATSSETFSGNLSGSVLANAATVPIINLTQYADGDVVTLTVEPGTNNQATFTGVKQSTPNRIVSCVWTEGNLAADHASGVTVIDYDSATHYNQVTKGIRKFANQDGSLITAAVQAALNISSAVPPDWTPLAITPTVSASYGQHEKKLVFPAVDYTDRLQKGSKLRIPRLVAPSLQSASFVAASSQYATKASPTGTISTLTNNYTIEAWVYLNSYGGAQTILNRYDGTNGYFFQIAADGTLLSGGKNGGTERNINSPNSIPLKKWVHVAAVMDFNSWNTTSTKMYIDGVDTTVNFNASGVITSVVQPSVDLRVGAQSSPNQSYFDGAIKEIRMWNTGRTPAQIRDNANTGLVGTETNLVGYWPMNGTFNDLTSSANNLTSSNGASAVNAASPFSLIEYAFVMGISVVSSNTEVIVFDGESSIPSATLAAVSYSGIKSPYGWPSEKRKWTIDLISKQSRPLGTNNVWSSGSLAINIPSGEWDVEYDMNVFVDRGATQTLEALQTLSTSTSGVTNDYWTTYAKTPVSGGSAFLGQSMTRNGPITNTVQTVYYPLNRAISGDGTLGNHAFNNQGTSNITAVPAYF